MAKDQADSRAGKDDLTRDDSGKRPPTDRVDTEVAVSRRTALKMAGLGTVVGLGSLFSGPAGAATTYDAVEDLGWDPTGSEPVEDQLAEAYGDNTTIQVPPGEYRVSGTAFAPGSASNFTLEGTGSHHHDVQFVADQGFRGKLLDVRNGAGPHTFRNFSIQQHDDTETSVNMTVKVTDGLLIEDVEHLGFTPDDGDGSSGNQLSLAVTSSGGTGVIRRYYNREGGQILQYPDRQAGVWVGSAHTGVLTFDDCVFIELGGSCIYATRHEGTVRVEGGYFANNDHHDMRISNERSDKLGWVRDAVFVGDYSLVNFSKADAHEGGEGTWIEHGTEDLLVENNEYLYRDPYPTNPGSGYTHFPGVVQIPDYDGDVTVRNCRLHNGVTDESYSTGTTIAAGGLNGSLTVEDSSFTGDTPEGSVVAASGIVENSTIEMVNGGSVSGGIDTSNISDSGANYPDITGLASVYPGHDSIAGEGGATDSTATTTEHTLEFVGTGTTANYEVTVSDSIQGADDSIESWDEVGDTTANGYVTDTTDRDAFLFTGEVTDIQFIEGVADVYVDGEQVDPDSYGDITWKTLTVDGTDAGVTDYAVTVDGDLENNPDVGTLEEADSIDGGTASGSVDGDVDGYQFTGQITDSEVVGDAAVLVDGATYDVNRSAKPTIDRYEVTEAGSRNAAANIVVEWDVSDADGDLSKVTVEVVDGSGSVVTSSSTAVSGDVAYDVDYFEIEEANDDSFDVRATVTDDTGKEASAATTVTE